VVLLFETGFVYFLLLELFFEFCNVVKGHKAVGTDVMLAGLSQVEITVLPKYFLSLCLLHLPPGLLQRLYEGPALIDEDINDQFELLGVFLLEIKKDVVNVALLHV
jgi:hypothetical protein